MCKGCMAFCAPQSAVYSKQLLQQQQQLHLAISHAISTAPPLSQSPTKIQFESCHHSCTLLLRVVEWWDTQ